MRGIPRRFSTAWLLLALAPAAPIAASATQTSKSVKQCNNELRQNEAALEAAGESASTFFHECWWHTKLGTPTPVQAAKAAPNAPHEAVATTEPTDGEAAHPLRHPSRVRSATERRERRLPRFALRRRRGEEADTYLPSRAAEAVVVAPSVAPGLPTEVNVNVPAVGSVSVPILPLPGLAATVRDVVDHPIVPGLVTATP